MKILVTGGCGFIGSTLVKELISTTNHNVANIDCISYSGNLENLKEVDKNSRYSFFETNILDINAIGKVFDSFQPDYIIHLAAESHVDRSIDSSEIFLNTNIIGTYNLLETSRHFYCKNKKPNFRFLHVSTDEVYGDLSLQDKPFTETSRYKPSSPYSASKASSDHIVRSWGRTYGLPVLITNCSNNYGPFQFPEKLIPIVLMNATKLNEIPIYGDGLQIRDWLYVKDHVDALLTVLENGKIGETYNIGGNCEMTNIDIVKNICSILDELIPPAKASLKSYKELITFVDDRPGHDRRYSIDSSKINNELDWFPKHSFNEGIRKTVNWYLENIQWCQDFLKKSEYDLSRLGGNK